MNDSPRPETKSFSAPDLEKRRRQIRQGLKRANTAGAVILMIVIGLALAAIVQAFRAEQNAGDAEAASTRARDELYKAQLARAKAERLGGVAGRKTQSLAAVGSAAAIHPSNDLRDEAVAAFALSDINEDSKVSPIPVAAGEQAVFAPALDLYAICSSAGAISVNRVATRETIARFQGPKAPATRLSFSAGCEMLAAGFLTGEIVVWELATSNRLFSSRDAPQGLQNQAFDFSPDHRLLAVADHHGVRLVNLSEPERTGTMLVPGEASAVAFSPQGDVLAMAFSSNVMLWAVSEHRIIKKLEHPKPVYYFMWHPDGRRLAVAANTDIWLWDTDRANHLVLTGHMEQIHHLAFNRRGDLLTSSAWDASTRFWDVDSGELLFVSRGSFNLAFSSDDTRIGGRLANRGLAIWRASPSALYRKFSLPFGSTPYFTGLDFSPKGDALAGANADGIHLWDVATGQYLAFGLNHSAHSVSFTRDGTGLVVVGADRLHQWRLSPGARPAQLVRDTDIELQPRVSIDGGTVSAKSHLLTVPSFDRVFCVDLEDPRRWWELPGHGLIRAINSTSISADTNWIATSYWKDRGTYVWDTRTRQRIHDLGASGGFVNFSPDDRWLLVGSSRTFTLWNTKTWRPAWQLSRSAAGELVGRGAFSPDGQMIALCPEVNLLELVETRSGRKLAALHAPTPKNIGWVAFSPDGANLAAATFDKEIQLWDLRQLHAQLASLGLDWPAASSNDPLRATSPGIASTRANHGLKAKTFYVVACLGALLAMFTGIFTLRYHQALVHSYEEVENVVTQRNRELEVAQAEVLHSQKMKAMGTLAAGIAHDFNNLLSVIRMGNNLQSRPDISSEDKSESSRAVEHAVEQGKKVVRSMLGYSREQPEQRRPFSVPELVDEVVLLLNKQFLGGLTLTLELDRKTRRVNSVRGRLEQILLNLIVNAAEALDGHGRLRVAARDALALQREFMLRPRPAECFVELVVSDNGPGIDRALRHRVFEPFFSTKPQSASSGTGLGLSLVHSLAEQEGLGICLESQPGEGTTFTILIPAELHVVTEPDQAQVTVA